MTKLEIFDPAMCCSTGVCGPSPDEKLVAFAGLLKRYEDKAEIHRYNLSQDPKAFVNNAVVGKILSEDGPNALPVVLVDGKLVMKGLYPSADQLEDLLGGESCCDGDDEACCGGEGEKAASSSSCCEGDSCC